MKKHDRAHPQHWDEQVLYNDQRPLLRVSGPTRLRGAAHAGVDVLGGGTNHVVGIICQRPIIAAGGTCYTPGYIRAVSMVAAAGFPDVAGHLEP